MTAASRISAKVLDLVCAPYLSRYQLIHYLFVLWNV
jgi:hypothetical protein